MSDHELAAALAAAAVRLLETTRADELLSGRSLGDAGDAIANQFLCRALAQTRPDDALLSEETADDPVRAGAARTWIIDPLDGTREFSEYRDDWAVHVALVEDSMPTAAAVGLPGIGVFSTASRPLVPAIDRTAPRIAVSRSRPAAEATLVADAVGGEIVPLGSAGYKAMAVLRGEVDAYVHSGGQYEWDSAAPVGVALAAGLHCSRLDGAPLIYNQADVLLPDLLVCRPGLAASLLDALTAVTA